MSTFHKFAKAVHDRYMELAKNELYLTDTSSDEIVQVYLAAFPEGTNPIFRVNTEHDCSCCKQFIKTLGRVVGIVGGKVETIWGPLANLPAPYDIVAAKLDEYVKSKPLKTIFRTKESRYGAEKTHEDLGGGDVRTWHHFHGTVQKRHLTNDPGVARGKFDGDLQVFRRGVTELKESAIAEVLDLIASKALYRGEEHLKSLQDFKKLQASFKALDEAGRDAFLFSNFNAPGARFRNTVIGVLVTDLSEGMDIEVAVRKFEAMVAPTNYKRTTALITPKMVESAMQTIREKGLEPALERRMAKLSDISINNVLWADHSAQSKMRSSLESALLGVAMKSVMKRDPSEAAVDITVDEFVATVIPKAIGIDVLVKNAHQANFVTLTAPVHADAPRLFKWDNGFAWSYDGNVTDSIKERVKRAGGDVDAKLRFSLAWFNYDDLDLHVEPPSGPKVYFGNKQGILDVDMNAGGGRSRTPVENASFRTPRDGKYKVWVNQFNRRETCDTGFEMEVAHAGGILNLSYQKAMSSHENALVGTFEVKAGAIVGVALGEDIHSSSISQKKWGLDTETFVKVDTMMLSPNHWDGQAVGNKHLFFMIDGCVNPDPVRGVYNEFLRGDLEEHRKVFEVVGNKTQCPSIPGQLSGLGFSSTRGDKVTVAVHSERNTRHYNIHF